MAGQVKREDQGQSVYGAGIEKFHGHLMLAKKNTQDGFSLNMVKSTCISSIIVFVIYVTKS